ncbi:hypothetical protein CGRA01v4_10036 [Colletotrichum graminicola]|nr:hypothetical protein CGRA01v4_10036 [Colletotrichum graminicola]
MDTWAWPVSPLGLGALARLQGISLMGSSLSNMSLSASCIRIVAGCSLPLKFSFSLSLPLALVSFFVCFLSSSSPFPSPPLRYWPICPLTDGMI